MTNVIINYWAVLACGIASMVVGFLWYGPLFGKPWMKLMGITPESMQNGKSKAQASYAAMFITSLITAYILKHFLTATGAQTAVAGMTGAFWAWLGFYATTQLGSVLWENKPIKLYLINTSYSLTNLLIAGAILAVWK